jgi:carbonic anhydrase
MVMAHTKCGAVTAAVRGADEPGLLGELLRRLAPTVRAVAGVEEKNRVAAAILKSVEQIKADLPAASPVIASALESGRIKLVGAVYDLDSNQVNFLP